MVPSVFVVAALARTHGLILDTASDKFSAVYYAPMMHPHLSCEEVHESVCPIALENVKELCSLDKAQSEAKLEENKTHTIRDRATCEC